MGNWKLCQTRKAMLMLLIAVACTPPEKIGDEEQESAPTTAAVPQTNEGDPVGMSSGHPQNTTSGTEPAGSAPNQSQIPNLGADNNSALPVLNPAQPSSKNPNVIWIKDPGVRAELYAATGPIQDDVLQGADNDCVAFALMGAMLSASPKSVTSMFRLAGKTSDGTDVYAVSLYDVSGKRKEIFVDTKFAATMIQGGNQTRYKFLYDNTRIDLENGSAVIWPSLAQKALAVYFGGYELFPSMASAVAPVLTGRYASAIMDGSGGVEDFGSPSSLLQKYLKLGSPVTVDSFLSDPNQANDGSGLMTSQEGLYNCVLLQGYNYCLVQNHEYEVLAFDGNTVTVRNPWGINIGSSVKSDGVVLLPLSAYTALANTTWALGRPVAFDENDGTK